MAYTDYEKMKLAHPEKTFIELTDDNGVGVVDEAKIAGCIEAADSEIDGYIPETYDLPLSPVPRVIVRLSTVIAIYNCYARYAGSIPKTQETQYDNAVKQLEKIQSGKTSLRSEETGEVPAADTQVQRFKSSNSAKLFSDEVLKGF